MTKLRRALAFLLSIIPLNIFNYKNVILLVSLKKIRIYICYMVDIIFLKDMVDIIEMISIVCYNMKVQNTYYLYL